MHVAVIGAGIVGVTTAYELARDGHQVTVFERRSSVAVETSFANAGLLAPGYVAPWAAPGLLRKVIGQWTKPGQRDAAVRLAALPGPALAAWLWRCWRGCEPAAFAARRGAMLALARISLARTRELAAELEIEYERAQGLLVLLRSEQELAQTRLGLKLLTELEIGFHLVDAAVCRRIEPALSEATAVRAGIHMPGADVGNCRQFALGLKAELQRRGVEFRLSHVVQRLTPGATVAVDSLALADDVESRLAGTARDGTARQDRFDAVVVCAALESALLLRPHGLVLPLQPVYGYSITLPVRHFEAHPDVGPRAALMDERYKVAISRLGDRVRVAGAAELGGAPAVLAKAPITTLHRVLQDWFPSAARHSRAQTWKGARPMTPDGPPLIGPAGAKGLWVNTGHGSSGWALARGSARLIADAIGGRASAMDATHFLPQRWR